MLGSFFGAVAAIAISTTPAATTRQLDVFLNTLPAARTIQKPVPPTKRRLESLGVKTTGQTAFVADVSTGSVLYAKDPHRVLPIASLTKLVTAMVFLDQQPDLQSTIVLSQEDQDREGKIVLPSGETFTLDEILKSMLVGSVNASANAIARVTGGEERFVALMNQKMKQLKLHSAVFVEPSGVDPENRASAADVAAMVAIASGYPKIREYSQLSEIVVRGAQTQKPYTIKSTNLLLTSYLNKQPFQIVAAKTGSLPEAGYCMAQVTRNAEGHAVVAVELGSDNHFSRYQDIKALTTWAFETYEWPR